MSNRSRVAVLGLYNSGSTAVAGMLHRLGVNLGPPFWANCGEADPWNFYEPYDLAWHLRRWWSEPDLKARVGSEDRVKFLAAWAALQETVGPAPIGAKHPLLSLCGADLLAAWGAETRFVWAWRPFADSLAGLQRRGWFTGRAQSIQTTLWDALTAFEHSHPGVVRLDWKRIREEPFVVARELASFAGAEPSDEKILAAGTFIGQH